MHSIFLSFRFLVLCLALTLAGGCGSSLDGDEGGGGGGGGGGSQDGGGGGSQDGGGGPGDDEEPEDSWHCVSENWPAVSEGDGVYSVATEHYQLELEVGSKERAEELGRMAEAAWLAFTEYFEGSPELDTSQRLYVSLFSTEERFHAALEAIGAEASDAGGYYSPSTQSAYLYEQPNPNYTDILFLHEMTHQFHHLSRTGSQKLPFWYVEGIAEYLGRHDWDGKCIRLGVVPMLSWEDLPGRALESISTSGLDSFGILSGEAEASRAESWAMIAYLERGADGAHAEAFAAFRAVMDADNPAGPSDFEELVLPLDAFESGVAEWLPTAQEPLKPIYTEWMHVAPGTVRSLRTGLLSLARVKAPHTSFELKATVLSSGTYAGVLTGFTDSDNFVAYLVGEDLQLSEFKVVADVVSWEKMGLAVVPKDEGSFHWSVTHSDSETQVEVNGVSFTAAGGFEPVSGPAAYDAEVLFTDLEWD